MEPSSSINLHFTGDFHAITSAHGCNSVLATRMALAHADYAVTEAGFAFDLGGEKFIHIKCRRPGLAPAVIVIVATVRALKMHGSATLDMLTDPAPEAPADGLENLAAHLDSAALFHRPVVVAINRFATDDDAEIAAIKEWCASRGVSCAAADAFNQGGEGCRDLADLVAAATATVSPPLPMLYEPSGGVRHSLHTIATKIYGAEGVQLTPQAEETLALMERSGLAGLPLCIAKTQNSLSDDSVKRGRPPGFYHHRARFRDRERRGIPHRPHGHHRPDARPAKSARRPSD